MIIFSKSNTTSQLAFLVEQLTKLTVLVLFSRKSLYLKKQRISYSLKTKTINSRFTQNLLLQNKNVTKEKRKKPQNFLKHLHLAKIEMLHLKNHSFCLKILNYQDLYASQASQKKECQKINQQMNLISHLCIHLISSTK